MGRPRTTGCNAKHWLGEHCKLCARVRARKSRARQVSAIAPPAHPIPVSAERLQLDAAAAEHRRVTTRARAYIAKYRSRGAIIPPDGCEHCAAGQQLTRYSKAVQIHPWPPNPSRPRDILWLCAPCRNYARAAGEPVELRWQWPGTAPATIGRPRRITIATDWLLAASAASEKSRSRELSDQLFFVFFSKAAGEQATLLYNQATRTRAQGYIWQPTGDTAIDDRLRQWAEFEHTCRQSTIAPHEAQLITPIPLWHRRPRIDQARLLPPDEPIHTNTRFDKDEYERKVSAALDKLANAEAEFDALMARLEANSKFKI